MKRKTIRIAGQIITYLPLAAIVVGGALLNPTTFQRQLLMLFLLIWANVFFLYKSWLA